MSASMAVIIAFAVILIAAFLVVCVYIVFFALFLFRHRHAPTVDKCTWRP